MPTALCKTCKAAFEFELLPIGNQKMIPNLCTPCAEERGKELERKQGDAKKREKEAQWAALCPPLYRDTDPHRLPKEPLQKALKWQMGAKGLLLRGETGRGKTRIATLLLNRLHHTDGLKVRTFFANHFSHSIEQRFGECEGAEWIAKLSEADVVFFDDLGKFKLTERVEAELFGLIEERIANLKPIIATTNLTGAALVEKMTEDRGAPLVRRLREFCELITV